MEVPNMYEGEDWTSFLNDCPSLETDSIESTTPFISSPNQLPDFDAPLGRQKLPPTSDPWSTVSIAYADTPAASSSAISSPRFVGEDVRLDHSLKRRGDSVDLTNSKRVQITYGYNTSAGEMRVFGPDKPRRSRYDDGERREVARIRRQGACARCRKHKAQCRERERYVMCRGCRAVRDPMSLMPCFLNGIGEAQLFRHRPSTDHPLYFLRHGVYELQSAVEHPQNVMQVHLEQGVGETLTVNIALYDPQPGDKTTYTYIDGLGMYRVEELPPYCLVDLNRAKKNMLDYVDRSQDLYIHSVMGVVDPLTVIVLTEAVRFATLNETSTTRKALNLLAVDRIIERDWLVCEGDVSDIPSLPTFDSPGGRRRPITPMMDGQLDQLVIQGFLQPLRTELLEQLSTNIHSARRENWFDIFLTTFVLLANAEQLLAHSRRNAIRHGAQGRYNSPELASLYFHACKIFISHFHFVSNFKMLASIDLFSADINNMAKLDQHQINFLLRLQDNVRSNKSKLLQLRENHAFEQPSYWTHQMMFQDWSPSTDRETFHIDHAPPVF